MFSEVQCNVIVSWFTLTSSRCFLGPTPDSMSNWGDPTVPADRMTSFIAYTFLVLPPFPPCLTRTPMARFHRSKMMRSTWLLEDTARLEEDWDD
jgi:hypothetical protein